MSDVYNIEYTSQNSNKQIHDTINPISYVNYSIL